MEYNFCNIVILWEISKYIKVAFRASSHRLKFHIFDFENVGQGHGLQRSE